MKKPSLPIADNFLSEAVQRQIPYSSEAETKLIGCILLNPQSFGLMQFLTPPDFHSPAMRMTFEAMQECYDKGEPISPITVRPRVKNLALFEDVGGFAKYIVQMMAFSGAVLDPMEYAKYVHELGYKRRLLEICNETTEAICSQNDTEAGDTHAARMRDGIEAAQTGSQMDLFIDNHSVIEQVMRGLQRENFCYPTGLSKLDKAMDGGLYPGKAYGFCARKKTGKSALAATISANLNAAKTDHLLICGEMSAQEIQQRILNRYSETWPTAFRTGYGKSDDFNKRMSSAIGVIPRHTFYYNAPGLTFASLRRSVSAAIERKKCKGFILDYWQLVGGKQKGQSTSEHLDEVAQWVADYCRKRDVWAVVMAQLNQDDNTRGSEGIRLAFDQVYSLVRKDLGQPHASLDMLETRYTEWCNIDGLMLDGHGPYFKEVE